MFILFTIWCLLLVVIIFFAFGSEDVLMLIVSSVAFVIISILILIINFTTTGDMPETKPQMVITLQEFQEIQDVEWILDRYEIVIKGGE